MTREIKNNQNNPMWKTQVRNFFGEKRIPENIRDSFRNSLLSASFPSEGNLITPQKQTGKWTTVIVSSILSATLAASATFMVVNNTSEENPDPIAELTQLPGPKVYPPDFDLEGDSLALQDIVYELFADKDYFVSKLPAQILAEYKPSEGRFFSWDGEPAVSIQMNQNNAASLAKLNTDPATLFIVKLSEKSQRKFPKEKVTRKVAGRSGKMHKVKVWREGKYGYAMVQSVAVTDTTP